MGQPPLLPNGPHTSRGDAAEGLRSLRSSLPAEEWHSHQLLGREAAGEHWAPCRAHHPLPQPLLKQRGCSKSPQQLSLENMQKGIKPFGFTLRRGLCHQISAGHCTPTEQYLFSPTASAAPKEGPSPPHCSQPPQALLPTQPRCCFCPRYNNVATVLPPHSP